MTRSATTDITLNFTSTITNVLGDGSIASVPLHHKVIAQTLANGVSANQANRVYHLKNQTILSGNTVDLSLHDFTGTDLGAGTGQDALGQAVALEEIVLLIFKQNAGPGRLEIMPSLPGSPILWIPKNYLTVSGAGALKAGSVHLMYQPDENAFDVTNGISEWLRLGANGGDVTYEMLIVGRHDDNESSSSSSSSQSSSSSSSQSSSSSSSSQTTSSTSSQSTEDAYSSSSST